jgi:hypothetical protein
MQATIEERNCSGFTSPGCDGGTSSASNSALEDGRVEFRHASGHLGEKRPGYYLIMLRNEIRHRSLREKPALNL